MLGDGLDASDSGLMGVGVPLVGGITPFESTVSEFGSVPPAPPLLFNRLDGIRDAESRVGDVPLLAALLRVFGELVDNGGRGLTEPVVGDGPAWVEGADASDSGLIRVGAPLVGGITPFESTVSEFGSVPPAPPLLFNRLDGIRDAESRVGDVPLLAALLRVFGELVDNGGRGLTEPVVGDGPAWVEGADASDSGLMGVGPLLVGTVTRPESNGDGVPFAVLPLGAVGNAGPVTEAGLRAACIVGFGIAEDGVGDGTGEFTGVEANLNGFTGVFTEEGTGVEVNCDGEGEFTGELTDVAVGLSGFTGVVMSDFIGVGVGIDEFTGETLFGAGVGVADVTGADELRSDVGVGFTGEFTGVFTGVLTGVVTLGICGIVMRGVLGISNFCAVCTPVLGLARLEVSNPLLVSLEFLVVFGSLIFG